ncbi:unnamed protein product [Heterobilharzia americana]|nr:unnamed protein product [Heterobilharzia americana]
MMKMNSMRNCQFSYKKQIMGDEFNAQAGKLRHLERQLEGFYGILCQRTTNDDRLLQFCCEPRSARNFCFLLPGITPKSWSRMELALAFISNHIPSQCSLH